MGLFETNPDEAYAVRVQSCWNWLGIRLDEELDYSETV